MKTNKEIALELVVDNKGNSLFPTGFELIEEAIEIASIQDVHETVTEQINAMAQRPQVQYDTKRQLMELRIAANKLGLYDAADFLRSFTEK